ncbi:MAG: inositol monophosphatase [Chloroflexi bacterium]|nr:inositol monophosphatase [Chloroflexota bacterium]
MAGTAGMPTAATGGPPPPPEGELREIEAVAVELARMAGERIMETLTREIAVEYKDEGKDGRPPSNPVSEVDRAVEDFLRERLAERFPDHGILGEEIDTHPDRDAAFVWIVDPVDGTTNFVNGFPLYAVSIGVTHHGLPVVGAVWCSTGHALRPGVYHAHLGGALHFEGEPMPVGRPASGVTRKLGAGPAGSPGRFRGWDIRVTGSAAIECAFVAAGIFQYAVFTAPSIWDVAGGVCLSQAAGLSVMTNGPRGVEAFSRFEAPVEVQADREPSLRDWRQFIAMGQPEATGRIGETMSRRRSRVVFRVRRLLWRFAARFLIPR